MRPNGSPPTLSMLMRLLWTHTQVHCGIFPRVNTSTRTKRMGNQRVSVLKRNKHFCKWMRATDVSSSLEIASRSISKETGRATFMTPQIPADILQSWLLAATRAHLPVKTCNMEPPEQRMMLSWCADCLAGRNVADPSVPHARTAPT